MSPEWAMVLERFNDMGRQLARLELRLDEKDRAAAGDAAELRDQMQRTRDEVAALAGTVTRNRDETLEAVNTVAERVEHLESTRKADVAAVVDETVPGAVAIGVRRAPKAWWRQMSTTKKAGAVVTIVGGLVVIIEGVPKLFRFIGHLAMSIAGFR